KREKRKNKKFYERETQLAQDRYSENNSREKVYETNELNINNEQLNQNTDQQDKLSEAESSITTRIELLSATNKMDKLKHTLCPICNEKFLSIVLVMGECRRCYSKKTLLKKFSVDNNIDPGEVPEELQNLTDIEEMLIAQVFPNVQEFTTRLPRHLSSLDVLVVRHLSANSGLFRDFNVRRDKVASALYWLKANNIYYADITIDNEILQSLPTDGTIEDQIPDNEIIAEESNNENEDEIDDMISRTFVLFLPSTSREEIAINETLNRIQNENHPIAWPHINDNPINEFRTLGYIVRTFLMLYSTGYADLQSEWIRDINSAEYFKHLLQYKDGQFAHHNRDEQLTVQEIQEMIAQGDKHIADRIMRYGEGLHRSQQFWMAQHCELSDMIKQIGSRRLMFFTFSAADLHWPELHDLMPSNKNSTEDTEMTRYYHQNVINNSHIIAWFFNKHFETFLNNVLKHKWNLEDYWYQFEWQHRSSVHVHGIGKIQNTPEIKWMRIKEDENVMGEAVMYIDFLVTTINLSLNTPIPDCHLCKKQLGELRDDLQDYTEFSYPKENSDYTIVHDDRNSQPELSWQANVDLKPILSLHAALQYISKYASKVEPQSATFSEILNQILRNSNPDNQVISSVQRLLLRSVAERDIFAQKTCHLLLGIPLYHSNARRTVKSSLKIYWERPTEFENFSLFQLNLTHKFTQNQWNKCKQENIVEFCRVKVLLHIRHKNIEQLTENGTVEWSTLFTRYYEEINVNRNDILGPPVDNEDETTDDENQMEEIEDDEQEECQNDWMLLAEMGPNAVIDSSCDLGTRDIDRNHRWVDDARQCYSDTDLANIDNFISQASSNNQINDENLNSVIIAGTESMSPVLVLALTGVAAFNINSRTIHSALSITINSTNNFDIDDEKSIVGYRLLALIDMWLRQAFPEQRNELFGGRSVIKVGDFGQLASVLDLPMYIDVKRDVLSNNRHLVYKQFLEAYKLDIVQRQSGDSEEQQAFRDILLRIRDRELILDDWKILNTRFEEKLTKADRDQFSDVIFILPRWSDVNAVNIDMLRSLNVPVAKINAKHTGDIEAKRANSDTVHSLEAQLLLARDAQVMLTANI
ncbi:4776_t:CDS:10, partial [Scutellospora calospora]